MITTATTTTSTRCSNKNDTIVIHNNKRCWYLYNNEYDKAIAIHKAHLNDDVGNNYTWTSLLQFYIDYYRDKKNDVQIFEKLYEELGLKWDK